MTSRRSHTDFAQILAQNVAEKEKDVYICNGFVLPDFRQDKVTLDALRRMFKKHALSFYYLTSTLHDVNQI